MVLSMVDFDKNSGRDEELLEVLDRKRTRWNVAPFNKKKTSSYEIDEYFCGEDWGVDDSLLEE